MNAVVQHTEADEMRPAAASEATAIVQMIERVAMNPAVNIDTMERLLQMQERVIERQAKTAFWAAFAEMQPNIPTIDEKGRIEVPAKDGKTGHSTPFARWEDINEAIRPILAAHGFGLSFRTGLAADGKVTVTGILSHREGHAEETTMTLTHDSTGSKNAVQAVGSSTSYGKRYTAMALLNITSRGEDDDGVAAGQSGAATTAIASINGRETVAALREWRKLNEEGLAAFSDRERKEVIDLYNRRLRTLRDKEGAAS